MIVKKTNGKIFGADLTSAERKALNIEIERQLREYDKKHLVECDALILWTLHEVFGFGVKRLRKYYDAFVPAVNELIDRYEMEKSDDIWLCTMKLKDIGVDLEKWHRNNTTK